MTMEKNTKKDNAYSQAVASGKYNRESGLRRKYDHVRVKWEDYVTRRSLQRMIEQRVQQYRREERGIRILDLGCGSGDGYEMLMEIDRVDADLQVTDTKLIGDENLELYKGIEINRDLLNQNAERWGENPKMISDYGDFSQGLPVGKNESPYDIYFTSYGALSHLNEDQTVRLLCDIARHAEDGAVLVGDWLGRYSIEWQTLWTADTSSEQWMDYYISYIYPPEQRNRAGLTPIHLRLLSRQEIMGLLDIVKVNTGIGLELECLFDRSVFVGRHMDTGDYNPHLRPLRQSVNSLFERNLRTDLDSLHIDYHPKPGMTEQNNFFLRYHACWNALIRHVKNLCGDRLTRKSLIALKDPTKALRESMHHMNRVIAGIHVFNMEDARANIIEPQLAYALRHLEMTLQRGMGNGHSLVGIFTVRKPRLFSTTFQNTMPVV